MNASVCASSKSSSTSAEYRKSNEYSIVHDILCTVSYFINIFMFFTYAFVVTKFCKDSLKYFNDKGYLDVPDISNRYLSLAISILVSYTWSRFYSSSFDGDAFSHVLYYRYRIINIRELICRVAGTMAAGALFGYLYYIVLEIGCSNMDKSYEILKKMANESSGIKTLMDVFVFPALKNNTKDTIVKDYLSRFLQISALKYEKNYFILLEKYVGLLVDHFLVEFIFCFSAYIFLSLFLSAAKSPSGYRILCVLDRRCYIFLSTLLLEHVNGESALDGAKSMFLYFEDFDRLKLIARLLGNILAALLVPYIFPLPKIMSLYEYRDIYVNTTNSSSTNIGTAEYPYLKVIKSQSIVTNQIRYGKWPNTKLGGLMSRIETFLSHKKRH